MKTCVSFVSLILVLCLTASGQQQGWHSQTSGTTEELNSVYFVNKSTGWIVGRSGTILKTTDAGEHWIKQNCNTLNSLKSVFFYDQSIGWCSGDMGKVYKTADGGETWTEYSAGTSARLNAIFFTSVSEGYVCGEYGTIMHSTDGGVSWSSQGSGQWPALTSIKFNNGVGRITMMGGQILLTINGGTTWEVENLNTASTINSVWFSSISDGIAVGDNGVLSMQNGTNWNTSQVFNNKNMMSVFMTATDTGWCAGQFGSISYTTNSWDSWASQISGTTQDLTALFFIDSELGWACGNQGTILRYVNNSQAQILPGSVVEENIDTYLSTPAVNYVKQIPVVVIRYLPTTNGTDLDVSQATDYWNLGKITLNTLKSNIDKYDKRVKFSLEEGSRYHGYKNSQAIPYLGYKVLKYISVYRQVYVSDFMLGTEGGKNVYQPDYKREFDSLNLKNFINQNHVKEVWMWYGEAARPGWPSYNSSIHGNIQKYVSFVESNMASSLTGDISNSYRFADDLYILDSTYVVYCQNFRRSQAEAVHNHGHQLESIYKHVANRQDGNISMFVQKFSGWGDNNYSVPPIGRAGDTHHPPNTTSDYDYLNTTLVQSDIEDWSPIGGIKKAVNVDTWGKLTYAWPGGTDFNQRVESQWYIYWMQNMPGYTNGIPYEQYTMTNWWQFTSDWDLYNDRNIGLYVATTGIADEKGPVFSLYPNPCRKHFTIQCSPLLVKAVEIVDLCGNYIAGLPASGSINSQLEFDISFLKPGVYFIRISADNQWFVRRLIKI